MILKYIEAKLEGIYNLNKSSIPKLIRDQNTPKVSIFLSKDFFENKNLFILIPDRGDNHPGVLDKTALFYESIKKGSVFPFLTSAIKSNYSVLLMNPNELKEKEKQVGKTPSELSDHYSHCECVWNDYIAGKKWENIIIVSHKLASISLIKLANKFSNISLIKRVTL